MSWHFIVDPQVEPSPDARERLEAARAVAPAGALFAAKVVLPGGGLDPRSEPVPQVLDKAAAIGAARAGLLAVRAVRPGALLVDDAGPAGRALVDAARHHAATADAASAGTVLAASAALLAGRPGHLVPLAVATRRTPFPGEPLVARLALLGAAHWTFQERLVLLGRLAARKTA
jgi:hypothetical protein